MSEEKIEGILQERGVKYGPFSGHARVTQSLKETMHEALGRNEEFQKAEYADRVVVFEAIDMITHKLGRIANGDPFYDDSWDDIAGYAKLVSKYIDTMPPL